MASNAPPPRGLSPDDLLPPVEPPSAGFILQLFVVPGIIVAVVVMIWLLFNWLAQMGNDSDAFVRALSRNNEARWQAAFNLAQALRAERGSSRPRLTSDTKLASQLAEILNREIDGGSTEQNPLTLRIYLCLALGEFRVIDPLPTLIEAAGTQRSDSEADVRRAAIEGIARLADNLQTHGEAGAAAGLQSNEKLHEVLLAAADDTDVRTRAVAAVALGVIGSPAMIEKLQAMTSAAHPDVRYNAAVRLAQRGDASAVSVLAEMLDQEESAGVEAEREKDMQAQKRALITLNALRATSQLARVNPQADLSELQTAVDKLLADRSIDPETRIEATTAQRTLASRQPAAASQSP